MLSSHTRSSLNSTFCSNKDTQHRVKSAGDSGGDHKVSWLQTDNTAFTENQIEFTLTPYMCRCRNLIIIWEQQLQRQTDVNMCFHTASGSGSGKKLICIPVLPPWSVDRSPMWHVCNALDRCVRQRVPIPANITPTHRVAYEVRNIGPQLVTNSLNQSQFIATCPDLVCVIIILSDQRIISNTKEQMHLQREKHQLVPT